VTRRSEPARVEALQAGAGGAAAVDGTATGVVGAAGAEPGVLVGLWREHRALLGRWLARLRREPLAVAALVLQPMVWLALFGHLFAHMAQAASVPGGSYLRFMTAGAVVMTTFDACLQGGVELLFDRESGFLVRMLAAPARRLSIVTSRFLHLAAVTGVQGLVILVAAYVMGVRYASGLGGIAACLATGAVFGAGVTALSMALAFSLRSHAQFFPITGFAGLPLTFISSALVPLALMPGWMQAAARLNPMTYAIDAVRTLILNGWRLAPVASAAGALLAFDVCAVALAALALRRGLR
jgi:ABC-2 type transport system permease protein